MTQPMLEAAKQHHQAGRFTEAQALYRKILAERPQDLQTLHLLGIVTCQLGDAAGGIRYLRQAVAADPANATFRCNLAMALADSGNRDEAIAAYRKALQLDPRHLQSLSNLASALCDRGELDEAIKLSRAAIELRPDFAVAHNNLGTALEKKGDFDGAIAEFRAAVRLRPDLASAAYNLASALRSRGELDEAEQFLRQAIALKPDFAEAHNKLSQLLYDRGKWDESVAAARQAVQLQPGTADYLLSLANALHAKGDLEESLNILRQALALKPQAPDLLSNLGVLLAAVARHDEAVEALQKAADFDPKDSNAGSNLVYALNFHPEMDGQKILRKHLDWNDRHIRPLRSTIRASDNSRDPNRKLRIGYVSPDFRKHVVGRNILPLIREHDREHFEIFCYSTSQRRDSFTEQFRALSDNWRDIAKVSDDAAAQMIREDKVDILVDLALHMTGSRLLLFARKPAPVQITFAGYPGTTGVETIDYRFTDPFLDPIGKNNADYSEQSIRLTNSFWCYDAAAWELSTSPAVNELPTLATGKINFGCLNNFCKTNDRTLSLWAKVLDGVPASRLLLLSPQGEHRNRVREKLFNRVDFAEFQPREKYLAIYNRIDLGLDTFPYNGHSTSLDSLWMGVPVASLAGNTVASRAGFSQASNLGLADDLVANNPDQFVEIAIRWATDLQKLSELRRTLRERMQKSPLMNAKDWAASIESAYRNMWKTYCASPVMFH
jgi:predicted O-linked N-acetylglucosamine transferase (SPINDLY family)